MESIKKPDAGGTRREQTHSKDSDFQPIGRGCSIKKLAKLYYTGFDAFCQDYPPGTPISFLREAWDIIFENTYLVNDRRGGKRWKV